MNRLILVFDKGISGRLARILLDDHAQSLALKPNPTVCLLGLGSLGGHTPLAINVKTHAIDGPCGVTFVLGVIMARSQPR